jgi:hypothetical protein
MQPLTHHEILELVAPYARSGRRVDLAASQRMQRRVAFKPVEHAPADGAPVREALWLDNPEPGHCTLTRAVTLASGLEARLVVEGPTPAAVLERMQAVDLRRGLAAGPGWTLALQQRLGATDAGPVLAGARLCVQGLTIEMSVQPTPSAPAQIVLLRASGAATDAAQGDPADWPEDLLAVLGRRFGLLERRDEGWRAHLALPRREPARSATCESELKRLAQHLAQTLAEPPAAFHARWRRARLHVTLRRAVPLLVCIGLIAASPALAVLALEQNSALRMLVFNGPPLLLVLLFGLREMPRFEIPPWPRAPRDEAWRPVVAESPPRSPQGERCPATP